MSRYLGDSCFLTISGIRPTIHQVQLMKKRFYFIKGIQRTSKCILRIQFENPLKERKPNCVIAFYLTFKIWYISFKRLLLCISKKVIYICLLLIMCLEKNYYFVNFKLSKNKIYLQHSGTIQFCFEIFFNP